MTPAPQLEAITVPVTGDYVHIRFDEELGEDVPGTEDLHGQSPLHHPDRQ